MTMTEAGDGDVGGVEEGAEEEGEHRVGDEGPPYDYGSIELVETSSLVKFQPQRTTWDGVRLQKLQKTHFWTNFC